jgi:membrane protein
MAHPDLTDRPVSELIQRASQQTATLVRDEIRLAKLELQDKGKRLGASAGLLGGAGFVAVFGLGALIAAGILALATALAAWLAALLVAVGLLTLAGVLALTGKGKLEAATPPVPEEAIESAKHDVETIKEHVHHR